MATSKLPPSYPFQDWELLPSRWFFGDIDGIPLKVILLVSRLVFNFLQGLFPLWMPRKMKDTLLESFARSFQFMIGSFLPETSSKWAVVWNISAFTFVSQIRAYIVKKHRMSTHLAAAAAATSFAAKAAASAFGDSVFCLIGGKECC